MSDTCNSLVELPAPLTPTNCDLQQFAFMPLDVRRLLNSELWADAAADTAIGYAAMNLWSVAWHQMPAGSLPDRHTVLTRLSGLPSDDWHRVKGRVLASWVKCSDGRLYHPVVAEKALESWISALLARRRGRAGNAQRWGANGDPSIEGQINTAREMLVALNTDSRTLRRRFVWQSSSDPSRMPEASPNDPYSVARDSDSDRDNNKKDAAVPAAPNSDEADLYRRGKEVLGNSAGGLVRKLVQAKGGSIPLARAAVEQAATKSNAREYIGAVIRGAPGGINDLRARGEAW